MFNNLFRQNLKIGKLVVYTFSCLFIISLGQVVDVKNVNAAPPVAFDNWSENEGVITAPCPSNYECINGVSDEGILQRTLRAPNGEEYIQLLVVGTDQTGTTVTDESFVRLGGIGLEGISAKQTFNQSGVDQLTSQTLLNVGWANDGISPAIILNQTLDTDYLGVGYSDEFNFSADHDANGNVSGSFTSIRQTLLNSTLLTSTPATGQDVQTFVFRRASGTRVPNAGQATLPSVMGGQMGGGMGGMGDGGMGIGMAGGGAGGTVTWNAGDDVQVIWIGLLCEGCGNTAMGGGGGGGGGGMGGGVIDATFSYQSFDNLVDEQDPIATASIISTDPFTWPDPPFGTQPTLQP